MDESKLIVLLKEHFPSKEEFSSLKGEVSGLKAGFSNLQEQVTDLQREVREGFSKLSDSIDELKDSSGTLDTILEQYPVERIERLEMHAGLPPFMPMAIED